MNAQEYENAKDIVLDLLGWGVEPEYIADTGVSREVIFYVFTELHLRLPRNLDTTGLVPFFALIEPAPPRTPQVRPHHSDSSAMDMPPPSSIPPRHDAPPFTPGRSGHPSLPGKPHSAVVSPQRSHSGPSPILDVLTTAYEIPCAANSASDNADLHEIELLRKQELVARKAVQASRKNKAAGGGSPSSLASTPLQLDDIAMSNTVPLESVDDFLKSIGSAQELTSDILGVKETIPAHLRRHASPDAMDVDDIPGLDTTLSRAHSSGETSRPGTSSGSFIEPPPSSADSNSDFRDASLTPTGINLLSKEDIPPGISEAQRRGTKRPVASDFVDFEAGPQRPYSANGYANGGSQPPSMRRKTTGSFASVSGMRRCVIDVSDSEDDDEGTVHRNDSEKSDRTYSPLPHRAPAHSLSHMGNGLSNGNQSPAALAVKEAEIEKMRNLIKEREETRRKKLAAVCVSQVQQQQYI